MLYYDRILVALNTLFFRCVVVLRVEVLSLCFYAGDTSACTSTQFTVACCIFSVHVTYSCRCCSGRDATQLHQCVWQLACAL